MLSWHTVNPKCVDPPFYFDFGQNLLQRACVFLRPECANQMQARGSDKAAGNEQLAVDMAARAESKKKEGDKALLKEAEAVVKAEKDLDSVSHLEKEESNEEGDEDDGMMAIDQEKEESNEKGDEDDGVMAVDQGRSHEKTLTGKAMSQTKERAECVGQCIQDCKEDCSDPDIVGEDNDNRGGDNWKTICGSQCDKDCLDECEDVQQEKDEERIYGSREQEDGGLGDDAQDETTGGRPYKRNVPNEEPPKWNALDDEDPDEPSDGSGKGVQQAMPPAMEREMDKECLSDCLPACKSECEDDARDADEGTSPALTGGSKECRKDCVSRCEDDCYIDDGGQLPDDLDEDENDPDGDEMGPFSHMDETASAEDEKLHQMLEKCVDSCQGDCMGQCLGRAGLGSLPPYELDPSELQAMRDRSGRPMPPQAVKAHLFCSEGCAGDCFKICEKSVATHMSAGATLEAGRSIMDAGMTGAASARIGSGPEIVRQGKGWAPGARNGGGNKRTVVLPAEYHHGQGVLFGSTIWQLGIGAIFAMFLALAAWFARKMCMGKGRARGAPMGAMGV